jgi:hypothetical protein
MIAPRASGPHAGGTPALHFMQPRNKGAKGVAAHLEIGELVIGGAGRRQQHHRHGRVESVIGRAPTGELTEFGAEHFISTMAIRDLIDALHPPPPDEVARAARRLRYRDYQAVARLAVTGTSVLAVRSFNYTLMTAAAFLIWLGAWRFGLTTGLETAR